MNQDIRNALCDMGYEEAILFDGPDYDDAIVGVLDDGRVVYDYDKIALCMVQRDGLTEDEALDHIEHNLIQALLYAGENAPVIMHPLRIED